MDPVSILGVVGSTAQLIDFTAKLIANTHTIYRSGDPVEHLDLLKASAHLDHLASSIQSALEYSRSTLTENDAETLELCSNCLRLTDQIAKALKSAERKSPSRTWTSFRQALKTVLNADKVESLRVRLDMYTQQLNSRLHLKTQHSVDQLKSELIVRLDASFTKLLQSHNETREETKLLRYEAEQRELMLREELAVVHQGLENCIKETRNKLRLEQIEQRRLVDITNTLSRLWVEKTAALESVLSYMNMVPEDQSIHKKVLRYAQVNKAGRDKDRPLGVHLRSPDPRGTSRITTSAWQASRFFSFRGNDSRSTHEAMNMQRWPGTTTEAEPTYLIEMRLLLSRATVPRLPEAGCFTIIIA